MSTVRRGLENPNKKKQGNDPVLSNRNKKKMNFPDVSATQIESRSFLMEDGSADDFAGAALGETIRDFMPNHRAEDILTTIPKVDVSREKRLSAIAAHNPSDISIPRPSAIDLPKGQDMETHPNSVASIPHITMPPFKYQQGQRKSLPIEAKHFVPPPSRLRQLSGAGLSDGIGSDELSGVTTSDDHSNETGQDTTVEESDLDSGADFKPKKGGSIPQFVKVKPIVPLPAPAHAQTHTSVPAPTPTAVPVKPAVTKLPEAPGKVKAEPIHQPPPPPKAQKQIPASMTSLQHPGKVPGDKSLPIHERLRRSYASETRVPPKSPPPPVHDTSKVRSVSPVKPKAALQRIASQATPKVAVPSDHKPPRLAPVASTILEHKSPSNLINPSIQSVYRRNPNSPSVTVIPKPTGSHISAHAPAPGPQPAQSLIPIVEEEEEEDDEDEESEESSEDESESDEEEELETEFIKAHLQPSLMGKKYDVNSSQQVMVGPPKVAKMTRHLPESIYKPKYAGEWAQIERGKTDYLTSNALAAIRIPPKIPIPRYVDDPKGKSHLWCPSGFARFYVYKPDFGRVPAYIKERLRAAKMRRREAKGSEASMTSEWESSTTEIPAREGDVFLDPRFGGAKFYQPKKRNPCMDHEAYSWNNLMTKDTDQPVRRECHIRKC